MPTSAEECLDQVMWVCVCEGLCQTQSDTEAKSEEDELAPYPNDVISQAFLGNKSRPKD